MLILQSVVAVINACHQVYLLYEGVKRFRADCAQMVRFVRNTEEILKDLQAEEDFTTPAWQECLKALVEAIMEIAGLLDICARYNVIRACMSAADLQLRMGAATRNLSLALQQCDVKQNMAVRSKLAELRSSMDSGMFQLMRSAEQAACDLKRLLDMEARSSEENRQRHSMNRELLEKILALLHSEPAGGWVSTAHSDAGILTAQRLEEELADLRAAVVCAKDSKQAQEEHYLRQIIQHIENMEAADVKAITDQAEPAPPANLVCAITRCLFEDPVIVVETGHTYERRAIEEHFLVNGSTNPLTNKSLELKTLTPNLNVRWQAEDWRKEHLTYIQPAAAVLNGSTALSMHGSSSSSRPHSAGAGTTAAGSSGLAAPVGHAKEQLPDSESAPVAAYRLDATAMDASLELAQLPSKPGLIGLFKQLFKNGTSRSSCGIGRDSTHVHITHRAPPAQGLPQIKLRSQQGPGPKHLVELKFHRFNLAICGVDKAGKTTLINSLLRASMGHLLAGGAAAGTIEGPPGLYEYPLPGDSPTPVSLWEVPALQPEAGDATYDSTLFAFSAVLVVTPDTLTSHHVQVIQAALANRQPVVLVRSRADETVRRIMGLSGCDLVAAVEHLREVVASILESKLGPAAVQQVPAFLVGGGSTPASGTIGPAGAAAPRLNTIDEGRLLHWIDKAARHAGQQTSGLQEQHPTATPCRSTAGPLRALPPARWGG